MEHNGGTVEQRCRKSRSSDNGAVVEQWKRDGTFDVGTVEPRWWNSGTSDCGTVEERCKETEEHLMVGQWKNHNGTVEHLMMEQ